MVLIQKIGDILMQYIQIEPPLKLGEEALVDQKTRMATKARYLIYRCRSIVRSEKHVEA